MNRSTLVILSATLLPACLGPIETNRYDDNGDEGMFLGDNGLDVGPPDLGDAAAFEDRTGVFQYATGTIPSEIDGYNDPDYVVPGAERVFDRLPRSGALREEPWSGSYWPESNGGIAWRWRTDESFMADLMTRSEAMSASPEEIMNLSPAEKYDLYAGNYGWSLTRRLLSETSPSESSWTGFCHGWAPASAAYAEPEPVTVVNPDGIEITFGSSDIKALLTYYRGAVVTSSYADHDWARRARVSGTVCGSANPSDPACHDTNPGTFHIIMANQLGLAGEHFLFDVDPRFEKWNQPAWGYRTMMIDTRDPGAHASNGAVKEVLVRTELDYTIEIEPTHGTVVGTPRQHSRTLTMHYTLDLDAEGRILGGQWQVPLQDGGFASLDEIWSYLSVADEDQDGQPDYSEDEIRSIVWNHFRFPDYVWVQDEPEWSEVFPHLSTGWELVATTSSTRELLYEYFARVPDLL